MLIAALFLLISPIDSKEKIDRNRSSDYGRSRTTPETFSFKKALIAPTGQMVFDHNY
jgi:hypothetical protein